MGCNGTECCPNMTSDIKESHDRSRESDEVQGREHKKHLSNDNCKDVADDKIMPLLHVDESIHRLQEIDRKLDVILCKMEEIKVHLGISWSSDCDIKRKPSVEGRTQIETDDKETQFSSIMHFENRGTCTTNRQTSVFKETTHVGDQTKSNNAADVVREILIKVLKLLQNKMPIKYYKSESLRTLEKTQEGNNLNISEILENLTLDKKRSKVQCFRGANYINAYPIFERSRNIDEFVQRELRSDTYSYSSHEHLSSVQVPHSMNMELIRLASFRNFPSSHLLSSITLARCGFYYTGENDKVTCFSCKASHSGWRRGDDPEAIHQMISPNCPLHSSSSSDNVPISGDIDNFRGRIHSPGQYEQEFGQPPNTAQHTNNEVNNTSTERSNYQQCTTSPSLSLMSQETNNKVTNESSEGAHHQPNSALHLSLGDITSLSSERTINSNETVGGDVSSSNNENSPNRTTPQITTNNGSAAGAQEERVNDFIRQLDPLGISFDRPKYPAYAVLATRISSFSGWPNSLTQTPLDLATAGFLYAGYGDYTRCFFCGGGLRNWDSDDDPWVEHARWFPKCVFVRQNKGQHFVALVQIEHQKQQTRESASGGSDLYIPPPVCRDDRNSSKDQNVARPAAISSCDQTDFLSLPACISVLEMGYSHDKVTQAFQELLKRKDLKDINGEDLLDVILLNEERRNNSISRDNSEMSLQNASTEISNSNPARERTDEMEVEGMEAINRQLDDATIEDTKSLMEENRKLKNQRRCKVCLDEEASIAMLPCGHLCCCPECAPAMRKCPICRQFVKGTVKTWLV